MAGMMLYFPVSAVPQFFEFSGEIWVYPAALAKPARIGLLEYAGLDRAEVNSGKKPCEFAKVVAFEVLSMNESRLQAAVLYLLFTQTPRSEPPAKAGAGFGPFWLGIGNDAHCDWFLLFTWDNCPWAHGPSMYMSSLP